MCLDDAILCLGPVQGHVAWLEGDSSAGFQGDPGWGAGLRCEAQHVRSLERLLCHYSLVSLVYAGTCSMVGGGHSSSGLQGDPNSAGWVAGCQDCEAEH